MPTAIVRTATVENPGLFQSVRQAVLKFDIRETDL